MDNETLFLHMLRFIQVMYFMEKFIDSLPNIHYINNKTCITLNYNKFYSY